MIVEGISAYHYVRPKTRSPAGEQKAFQAVVPPSTVKNKEGTATEERSRLLETIRDKMRRNFYNSDAVIENLSDSFASVFNELL